MKKILQFVLILGMAAHLTGCAGTRGYLADRGRDAADIFTLTVGAGLGAKARVGPVQTGLSVHMDAAGLRGGEFMTGMMEADYEVMDFVFIIPFYESFDPSDSRYGSKRHKLFEGYGFLVGAPTDAGWATHLQYATQIEVSVGLLVGLRFGFNPGELLDFVLGWTTIDIYDDDLSRLKKLQEEKWKRDERPF